MASKGFLIGTVFNAPPPVLDVECTTYTTTASDYMQSANKSFGIGAVWSMAFWQRRTTSGQAADRRVWISCDTNTVDGRITWLQRTNNTCAIAIRPDGGSSSASLVKTYTWANMIPAAADIEWEHIAIVYNANGGSDDTVRAYFNGVDITDKSTSIGAGDVNITKNTDGNPNQTQLDRYMTIGASHNGGSDWEGRIYNFGVWDLELDAADVAALYNDSVGSQVDLLENDNGYDKAANLQHYWRFANGSDRGEDLGVYATKHNLLEEDSGSLNFVTNDCPSAQDDIQDMSLLYDKTFGLQAPAYTHDSGIAASSGSSYIFSFACWAKFTGSADSGRNALMAVRRSVAASALDWGLDDNSNTDLTCILVNSAQSGRQFQTWGGVITPNAWHHIVLTWDGTTGTGSDSTGPHCYVDGVNVDSGNRVATLNSDGSGWDAASNRAVKVGTQIGGGTNWEGPMFSASIYNTVLAPAEVAELYANGNAQTVDPRVNTGNYVSAGTLIHYYRLGVGQSDFQFGTDETLLGNEIDMSDIGAAIVYPDDLTSDIPT